MNRTFIDKENTMLKTGCGIWKDGVRRRMGIIGLIGCLLLVLTMLLPAPVMAADLLHTSADTGSTKWQAQGGWGVTGGKYGKFVCATCHEPDGDNLKNTRSVISTMNGDTWPNGSQSVSVVFQNATSMGDDSVARSSSNRICEVCHSQNRFHNFNTANNTQGLGHPAPKAACISCHKHNTGFKAACGGCHGNPPTQAVLGGDYGLIGTPRPSYALTTGQAGAHNTHVNTRSMVCDTCHYITNGGLKMPNQSGTIQIGFFGFGGKVTSGTYTPYTSATRGYRFVSGTANTTIAAGANTYPNANKCANVYCHGGGTAGKAPLTGGVNQTPRWDATGQNACGNCHGTTAATPPTMGSHTRHAGNAGYSYYCDMCHPVSGDNSHVQGNVRWQLKTADAKVGTSATYRGQATGSTGDLAPSASYGQCANINCHSNGTGGTPLITPTWGTSLPADCSGCHGANATSASPIITGKHSAHTNPTSNVSLGTGLGCVECHAMTVANDTTIGTRTNHVNLLKDYSGARAGRSSSYSTATGVCSNAYCHSDGKGTLKNLATTGWNSTATLDCKGCHGSDATPAFAGSAGEPNYTNTGSGATKANSHLKHVGTAGAATCVYCHGATVNAAGTAIATGSSSHVNRSIDVVPGGGRTFTYAPGTKGCSNISCHSSSSAQWGGSLASDCTGCHGNNTASASTIATGKHGAHINQAALLGTNYGCVDCHAKTVSDDRTISNTLNHGNTFVDYSGARAGRSTSYATATGVCSATYCHTDGKGTQKDMTANNWKTGAPLDCTGCHGSDAAPDFTSVAGEPNYVTAGAGLARANSHKKHVGVTGAATCTFCHSATTSNGTSIVGSHTDRKIDVMQGGGKSFTYTAGTKGCASISCHGTGSVPATWGASMPADCTGCHGGNSSSVLPLGTGKHAAHTNQASLLGDNLGCNDCHAKTVAADRTISSTINHGNGFVDYSGARAGRSSSYSSATGVCSATYCHTDGKGTQKVMTVAGWQSVVTLDCTGCHGSDTAPAFPSVAGEPNYATGGGGVLRSNSHKNHAAAGASSCDTCHSATVTPAGTAIKPGSRHMDRNIDIVFNTSKANATWNSLSKTCSNITCHGGGSATWGDATTVGCKTCHGNLSATHGKHIGDLLDTGLVSFYNYTANKSSGSIYRFGCANCHPTDPAKHRDGFVDINIASNKVGAPYLTTLNTLVTTPTGGYTRNGSNSLTCETVYCHSNGRNTSLLLADYRQTPNWYGGSFGANRCGSCHDNPPQYAGQSHYNPTSSIGDNGKAVPLETGHMVGIHFMNTSKGNKQNGFLSYSSSGSKAHGNPAFATTISCYICHNGIVNSTTIDTYAMAGTSSDFRCANCHTASSQTPLQPGMIANTALHVNGTKNVAFAPITFQTKAQLSNVANALGWTRHGNYKAADSFDSFDLSVATWNPATKTCLTSCHVNQPGITWGAQLKCVSCHANQ